MASNTTTSHEPFVGWVTGPDQRGTLNLVWSCAVTVFACTWSVLHLNVPGQKDARNTKFIRKFKWMIINLLFPEFIFSKSFWDLRLAVKDLQDFRRKHLIFAATESTWIRGWKPAELPAIIKFMMDPRLSIQKFASYTTHMKVLDWFAHVLGWKKPKKQALPKMSTQDVPEALQEWTLEHSYYAQMGGLRYRDSWDIENEYMWTESCRNSLWTSIGDKEGGGTVESARALTQLVLAKEDIKDKSKADLLSRGIAVTQVSWAILNIVVRHATKLPITQMEIATVASAAIAALTYLVNWWKPKDVARSTLLELKGAYMMYHDQKMFNEDRRLSLLHRILPSTLGRGRGKYSLEDRARVPNDFCSFEGDSDLFFLLGLSSLGFGGLHCLAWKSEFPTKVEMYCWRTASLISAFLPAVALILSALSDHREERDATNQILLKEASALPDNTLAQLSPTWWKVLHNRGLQFSELWSEDAQIAFVLMQKEAKDWKLKAQPTTKVIEGLQREYWEWERGKIQRDQFLTILWCVMKLERFWKHGISDKGGRPWDLREDLDFVANDLRTVFERLGGPPKFWCDFEEMVNCESNVSLGPRPRMTCAQRLLKKYQDTRRLDLELRPTENKRKPSLSSEMITTLAIILYTAARLTIIVLLFTTLRRVPADVYRNTTWTRFIPNVS